MIASESAWAELLRFDLDHVDFGQLQRLVEKSIGVKERIVDQDPTERGLRKALNLAIRPAMRWRVWPWPGSIPCYTVMPWPGAWPVSFI